MVKYLPTYTKGTLKKKIRTSNDAYVMLLSAFLGGGDFLYKSICYGYLFELHWLHLVEAIQMSTHNICFYKEVDKSTLFVI